MKYIFDQYPDGHRVFQEGYTTLVIEQGEARVDANNPAQVAMAKQLGGQPIIKQRPRRAKAQKQGPTSPDRGNQRDG